MVKINLATGMQGMLVALLGNTDDLNLNLQEQSKSESQARK